MNEHLDAQLNMNRPIYQPHSLTYYQQGNLLAAVDIMADVSPEFYVCGYLLWEIKESGTELLRVEQNVVNKAAMLQIDVGTAAQLMTNMRCPTQVIETMLNIRIAPNN